jgi:hypothetical protein
MSVLAQLKLTTAKKSTQLSPVMQRRRKLLSKLGDQVQLAKAQRDGTVYAPTKLRTVTDDATGDRKTVQVPKYVKPWWFVADSGKLCVSVRYGAKVLALGAKGQTAVEVGSDEQLVIALDMLTKAVEGGELDAAIEAASKSTKANFKK